MIPNQMMTRVAAERRREFEHRAAEQRFARHLRRATGPTARPLLPAPRIARIVAALRSHIRPSVDTSAGATPGTCCCA